MSDSIIPHTQQVVFFPGNKFVPSLDDSINNKVSNKEGTEHAF